MFGTIRKHQKWLWIIIITLTVTSFVVYFSPYQRVSHGWGGRAVNLGSIDGQRVTVEAYREARDDVYLRYLLAHGDWPDKDATAKQMGFDEEREIYFRLLILQKTRELNIQVGGEAVGRGAAGVLRSYGRGAGLSLDDFERRILLARGMTGEDFERFLRHELALQQLIQTAGLAGTLITPEEAKLLYRREHEELTAALVAFPATNYLAHVTASPEALAQFYTNQLARYRIPERVQVSYVKFDLTNFWAEADAEMAKLTNLTAILDAVYEQRGTNYYREAKLPEEAKQLIKEELRRNAGLTVARNRAVAFANVVFAQTPPRAANLEKIAAASNLTVRVTAPFDKENGPAELRVGAEFTKTAFGLSEDEPFGRLVLGEDGVYLIAFNKRLPSEVPSLDAIRDQVTSDFKFLEAAKLAQQAGANFHGVLTNGMAQGKSFSSLSPLRRAEAHFPAAFFAQHPRLGRGRGTGPAGFAPRSRLQSAAGQSKQLRPHRRRRVHRQRAIAAAGRRKADGGRVAGVSVHAAPDGAKRGVQRVVP